MDEIIEWVKNNGVLLNFSWTIIFALFLHFVVFYLRRRDERRYYEQFSLYKTLVLDKTSQLFVDLQDDCDHFQIYTKSEYTENTQLILKEIEKHKEKIFAKYCWPIKLYDENLQFDLLQAVEIFYSDIAFGMEDSFTNIQDDKDFGSDLLSKSTHKIIEILKSGIPTYHRRRVIQDFKRRLKIRDKYQVKLRYLVRFLYLLK